MSELNLPETERFDLSEYTLRHILLSESLFSFEEEAMSLGEKYANLFYHGKEHAVYQTTYDTIYIIRSILKRHDRLSQHLTKEGIVAAILAACNHDTGYVAAEKIPCNFAARTPIHIGESIKVVQENLEKIEVPDCLDIQKVRKYISLGVYSTSFPFTPDHQKKVKEDLSLLQIPERREAQIVRLAVQLADLGGQAARVDYRSKMLAKLRKEMNCVTEGLGTQIIGNDQEILKKSRGFLDFVVKPNVGRNADALFGIKNHQFAIEWAKSA